MFKNLFQVKKGNAELIAKVMKEIERDYIRKHGSLEGLTENKLLEMANSYIAFELGLLHWREWVRVLYDNAIKKDIYSKWNKTFGEFLVDIWDGGRYANDTTDFVQLMRIVHKQAEDTEMSGEQKTLAAMWFALAYRLYGFNDPFGLFMKESNIPSDWKYQEMLEDFLRINRL